MSASESPDPADHSAGCGDLELAYRQALQALDEAERQVSSAMVDFVEDQRGAGDDDRGITGLSVGEQLAENLSLTSGTAEKPEAEVLVEGFRRVTPQQVIEAAVFVGGDVALTARRLASLIGQNVDARVAVSHVDTLNQIYARENRPYEIRLHEGGYRLELREQFREISLRMFGLSPRETRLSPDLLEVLALVAYNQPVTREDVTQIDRPSPMSLLRQLIRLQLVAVERTGSGRADVAYVTTVRFLKLFGLRTLADLPTADIFSFR